MSDFPERGIVCECTGSACPSGAENGTCVTQPGGYCFVSVQEARDDDDELRLSGCLPPDEAGLMQCRGTLAPHRRATTIECCHDRDLCNVMLDPRPPPAPPDLPVLPDHATHTSPVALVAAAICFGLFACVLLCCLACKRWRRAVKRPPTPPVTTVVRREVSSGSGAGLPLLAQRTVAKQIQMVESVGKGRRGEVWLARWRGERVAVKVFRTADEASWFRETEIYQSVLMRHEGVLGFIAADVRGSAAWTQMLLITEYHERGSLRSYLRDRTLSTDELLAMAHSLAGGLAHLHMDVCGTEGKPGVAHRDLHAGNVLVRRDGRCCIADFGLAARHAPDTGAVDLAPGDRSPAPRTSPPELLTGRLDPTDFEALKAADVYQLALLLWEMCRRHETPAAPADPPLEPYQEWVPGEATAAVMREVAAERRLRPTLPARTPPQLAALVAECWHDTPAVRLTALRAKKTLARLLRQRSELTDHEDEKA